MAYYVTPAYYTSKSTWYQVRYPVGCWLRQHQETNEPMTDQEPGRTKYESDKNYGSQSNKY